MITYDNIPTNNVQNLFMYPNPVHVHPARWPAARVGLSRPASEALTGSVGVPIAATGSVPPASPVQAAVARQLHGSCVYLIDGWWAYELCHQRHMRQFHVSQEHSIEALHTLGSHSYPIRASSPTLPASLHPSMRCSVSTRQP